MCWFVSVHKHTKTKTFPKFLHCNILSDDSLHETALDEGLPTHLIDRLKAIVSHMEGWDPPGVQSAGGEGVWGLLDPCIGCLLVLVTLNSEVREWLGRSQEFLMVALRG